MHWAGLQIEWEYRNPHERIPEPYFWGEKVIPYEAKK
jgi:hypothetical protein